MKTSKYITSIVVAASALLAAGLNAYAASWVVSSGQSLQTAINTAADGDNITVMTGTYNENIGINKGLTIQGSGGSVLVTGSLQITNTVLPVYISDITFGGASGTGVVAQNCQSLRMDRCATAANGNMNAQNCTIYFYKAPTPRLGLIMEETSLA